MPEHFYEPVLRLLRKQQQKETTDPTTLAALARDLGLSQADQPALEETITELVTQGRVILGDNQILSLPAMSHRIVGKFRQNFRGFGFVIPDQPNAHGDLFIPQGENLDAMTGDQVVARVVRRGVEKGRKVLRGRIVEILQRANRKCVGCLTRLHNRWIVTPDGNVFRSPVEVLDVTAKLAAEGDKVVVELTRFAQGDLPAQGVIVEVLGPKGEPEAELRSVIRQFDLPEKFPDAALDQARNAAQSFDPADFQGREDLSLERIITIDPDDARDFDDAISLKLLVDALPALPAGAEVGAGAVSPGAVYPPGTDIWELGVHIADVSAFVPPESPLDMEARARGNSTYFPRHVIPMLPEVLSNGVCSLQENQPRLTKSAFIRYDAAGNVTSTRVANTLIRSHKRLTYRQAQAVIDDVRQVPVPFTKGLLEAAPRPHLLVLEPEIQKLLLHMDHLARTLRFRRLSQGMIVLDLPEVELILDAQGRVIDAVPEDTAFTHKIIEMFMVEANEATARFLTARRVPVLRRVHPDPDAISVEQVRQFVALTGRRMPKTLDRSALQTLLDSVRGTPIAYAVHLAVLKTFTTAEYSPLALGHYALASDNYAHFTSPIRRYADLVIHRYIDAVLRGDRLAPQRGASKVKSLSLMPETLGWMPDHTTLEQMGKYLSFTERRSQDAERELRAVKVMQLLAEHTGDLLDGVITGVTGFGVFVQSTQFLVEGLVRLQDLPEDFWQLEENGASLRGQRSGRRLSLGDRVRVQIVSVNVPARNLELRMLEHASSLAGDETLRQVAPRMRQETQTAPAGDRDRGAHRAKKLEQRRSTRRAGQTSDKSRKAKRSKSLRRRGKR